LPVSAKTFEFLDLMSFVVAIDGIENLEIAHRERIFECFHFFYDDWSKRLEADKKAEQSNTSLYRFRGSAEDEEELDEEEFNELFPDYEDEAAGSSAIKKRDQVRDTSIKVAQAHRKLLLNPQEPPQALSDLCLSIGNKIAHETEHHQYVDRGLNQKLLAGNLLLLNDKREMLTMSEVGSSYNFYVDANHSEARLLVSLANRIKARFRQLQLVDEIGHMQPLADVIMACDKLLELTHTEPLARILPKVEQLHAYVYEWQFGGWASRAHAVLELHNALTETVIRWRRLELSTWAKLFDMEQRKCEDDAYSWWFVAYQVVVAVPLTMVDSASELREYAISLIQNLELYFSTSIVGQFRARLQLLSQLRNHLRLLVKDYPTLDVIHQAVANFIDFYARYETIATETITKGRIPIDKKMKDVLLMASWKDTNISALRESARKSHQKLFRLVRKFRGVLGKEMKSIIDQGLPDEDHVHPAQEQAQEIIISAPDATATAKLARVLPDWLENNRRLANAPKTVSIMSRVAKSSELATDVPSIIDSFVSSLNTSMAELRKETPPFLTDDNKEQVKYLKTRKRKLFADTLKDLRHMGLRYNLSQDRLKEQDSLAITLASATPITFSHHSAAVDASQYYLYKILDLAPKVRDALRDHSEELTSAEIARSVGFVEGMIHMLLSQRRGLASATKSWSSLQESVGQLKTIGDSKQNQSLSLRSARSNRRQILPWLIQIINFAVHLIEIHGKLDETSHDGIIQQLHSWSSRFAEHLSKWQALGKLPGRITSPTHVELETGFALDVSNFESELDQMILHQPNVAFIVNEVRRWSHVESVGLDAMHPTHDLTAFAGIVSRLCDKVLVAVEAARKAGLGIPRNEEDAGWFTKHDDGFSLMVRQLHIRDITRSIAECVDFLQEVDLASPGASLAAMGVANLVTPILEQFGMICRQCISRLLDIHRATAHMAFHLTRIFTQISSQGFCTPQEKSDESSGETGKVEAGTGLGEGEGAEDISKDIQEDEDLTELAQEANKEEKGDIEDEKDAVDMADEELEGEMGSVNGAEEEEEGSKNGDEEEEDRDMDEEAGDVDDLDPTAVDEKMWDGDDEEKADKDQQGDKSKGKKTDDEQMATEEDSKKEGEEQDTEQDQANGSEPEDAQDDDDDDDLQAQEELNKQEQTAQENDALALPEEMDLDFDDKESTFSDDDDLDALSDVEDQTKPEEQDVSKDDEDDRDEDDATGDDAAQKQQDEDGAEEETKEEEQEDEVSGELDDEVQDEPKAEEEEPEVMPEETKDEAPLPKDNTFTDKDNAAPSDVKSSGQDVSGEAMDLDDDEFEDAAAQQEDGEMGQGADARDAAAGNKGTTSRANDPQDNQDRSQDKDEDEAARSDPFKKLGDALERWHRQQDDIKEAKQPEDAAEQQEHQVDAADQGRREFQHMQNDDTAPDAQAMGTADEDEVQPIDESMAIDEEKQDPNSRVMEEDTEEPPVDDVPDKDAEQNDAAEAAEKESKDRDQDDGRSGVKTRQGNYNREQTPEEEEIQMGGQDNDETVEETSTQLSLTHISSGERVLRDFGECMQQWGEFQSKTHSLSLSLTSQLRLILTPSQSTKLSGSFRTGKRLNIKRIIPYIASSYKRDKIWMRRAIPTKRTYQILLCVDDSKSMGESSSGNLAMESLVMVSRSLTMLEAGQVGVVGFGADVFTAHNLTDPFAADAGGKVLQNFTFSQDRTDIALLIRRTIDTFRTARQQQASGAGGSDLWQLALILSDGLTPSSAHDSIRRLLREAMEERIMVVFIIMDDTGKKKGDSVLELKEAKFVSEGGESRVVIERYLDTFPFQYYLIVHHLEELPSALAGLLRTWFAEVTS
jgi:midasin